jgi:hypothetical protein
LLASGFVNPGLVEDLPNSIDAVVNVGDGYHDGSNPETTEGINARLALVSKLSVGDIMGEVVPAIDPSMLD